MPTTLARILASILGAGIVLLVFSEYVFFNDAGPGPAVARPPSALAAFASVAEAVLWYSLFALVFLAALSVSNARNLSALLLCGAVFGWVVEGTIIAVVHEAPPISFVWPSLSWHALVDVMLGWFALRVALRWSSLLARLAVFAAVGAMWGIWSTWVWPNGFVLTPAEFTGFAIAMAVLLTAGLALADIGGNAFRRLPRSVCAITFALALVLAVMTGLPFLPWSLGLFVLVAITALALWRQRNAGHGRDRLAVLDEPVPWTRYASLSALPAAAIIAYTAMYASGTAIPVEDATGLFLIAGAIAYVLALSAALRSGPSGENT